MKARRLVRRAVRLAADGRLDEAATLADGGCRLFRHRVTRGGDGLRREYADALVVLSDVHMLRMDLGQALAAQDELVQQAHVDDATDPTRYGDRWADALVRRGNTLRLRGDYAASGRDLDQAIRAARSPVHLAGAHNARGILAKDTGSYDEAERHYRRALELAQAGPAEEQPSTASILHNLAGLEHARGSYRTGESFARRAIALRTGAAGAEQLDTAGDRAVLAALLAGQGRLEEAEAMFVATLASWAGARGPDHYEVAVSLESLAAIHEARGDHPRARLEYLRALDIKTATLGPEHPEVRALVVATGAADAVTGPALNRAAPPPS